MKKLYQLKRQLDVLHRRRAKMLLVKQHREVNRLTGLIQNAELLKSKLRFKVGGFTILELSIVMLVIAIILGGLLMPVGEQYRIKTHKQMDKQSRVISEALSGYVVQYGRLPCPVQKDVDYATAIDCDDLSGYLPYHVLGLSRKFSTTYVVDSRFVVKFPASSTKDPDGFPLPPVVFSIFALNGDKRDYSVSFYPLSLTFITTRDNPP